MLELFARIRIRKQFYAYFFDYTEKLLFSFVYDLIIVTLAIFSILPFLYTDAQIDSNSFLTFINDYEFIFLTVFTIDYLARWMTADLKLNKGFKSFLIYPFTFWGIIDLIAILPSWLGLSQFQALLTLRLFRIVNFFPRLAEGISFMFRAMFSEWKILITILISLGFVVFIGAIFIFQAEYAENPDINSFGDALWFVFITITTIGFGDMVPVTDFGRFLTVIFAIIGIALIALVTATMVSGFDQELRKIKEEPALTKVLIRNNFLVKRIINFKNTEEVKDATIFNYYFLRIDKEKLLTWFFDNRELVANDLLMEKIETYSRRELVKLFKVYLLDKVEIDNEKIFHKMNKEEMRDLLKQNKINFKYRMSRKELLEILIENNEYILWG